MTAGLLFLTIVLVASAIETSHAEMPCPSEGVQTNPQRLETR